MRTLTLSIGNTSLFGGVFKDERLLRTFRLSASELAGLPAIAGASIESAAFASVVPALTPDVVRLIEKTWSLAPRQLSAASQLPFKIGYRKPREIGADRIAATWGAWSLLPKQNVIVVDCGTATTVTALSKRGVLLGGAILPGLSLWPEMLATRTAQLPHVTMQKPRRALGRSTREGIESGIFHGHLGAIRELVTRISKEAFGRASFTVVGTGGHAEYLASSQLFDRLEPALVLQGLRAFCR